MRESLNLATAGVGMGNGRGAAGLRGRLIGDRALFPGRGVSPDEDDGVGAFIGGKSVRIENCVANATGSDIRVAIS
jgi:hypothetical protein